MWRRLVSIAAVVALAGCGAPGKLPAPLPAPSVVPAANAGGACQLLDFGLLERMLGAHYTVAAAAGKETTLTCVARTVSAPYPQVTLSVAPSIADVAVFQSMIKPKDSVVVEGLGKVAYRMTLPPAEGAGPGLEVGWLAANARLLWLRVTVPSGGNTDELALRLVVLAQEIDKVKPAK